ncbi:MAG: anti-sigma factor family protein [Candidatus Zhuqueibacterota bacterium]
MESCKKFKALLSDYIEGGLDQHTKLLMEQHLNDCLNCSKTIARLKSLHRSLSELPRLKVSSDFETVLRTRIRVESGLERRRRERFSFLPIQRPVFATAALMLIFAGSIAIITQLNKHSSSYPMDASTNYQWYHGGEKQNHPSSNERVVYVMERQTVPYIQPDRASSNVQVKADSTTDSTFGQYRNKSQLNKPMHVSRERVY